MLSICYLRSYNRRRKGLWNGVEAFVLERERIKDAAWMSDDLEYLDGFSS